MSNKTPLWSLSAIVILGVGSFFMYQGATAPKLTSDQLEKTALTAETIAMQENNMDILVGGKISDDFNRVSPAAGDDEMAEDANMVIIEEDDTMEADDTADMEDPMHDEPALGYAIDRTSEDGDAAGDADEETTTESQADDEKAAIEAAVQEEFSNFEEEEKARMAELEANPLMSIRAIGNPDAPIVMEEFSSLTCPHCAAFHEETLPLIKEEYVDTGKVYLIFRDYPLNKPALEAAGIARCMPEDEYYDFITVLFRTQMEWATSGSPAKLLQTAKLAGLSDEDLKECLENRDLVKYILASMKVNSKEHDITSTPSFVINGGEVVIKGSKPFSEFKADFDKLLENAE